MQGRRNGWIRGLAVTIVVCGFLLAAGLEILRLIDQKSAAEEEKLVSDAITQALVTCYAAEGAYPESIDYLKEHYGLSYNQDEFFVSYDAFASNLMPDVQVTRKGAAE